MLSNRLHPLAAAILAPLGGLLLVDCGTTADGCPEVTTRTETFGDACEVELTSEQEGREECFTIELDAAGTCPAHDDDRLVDTFEDAGIYDMPACGPLGPAGPVDDSQRVASATGTGGGDIGTAAGSGGNDASGSGGTDASGGGGADASGAGGAPGGGGGGGGALGTPRGSCCYVIVEGSYCIGGRPFLVAGSARVAPATPRSDWTMSAVVRSDDELSSSARAALAGAWLRDAAFEHASVAAFSRFSLELLAVGAPPDLLEEAHRAGLDEIHHARLCFGLAARFGEGEIQGPGALSVGDATISTALADMVVGVIREGCVGETIAALIACRALEGATDPAVRAALTIIAEDEARHASLAWRFVAWAVRTGGPGLREVAQAEIARAIAAVPSDDGSADGAPADVLRAHGRVPASMRRAIAAEALRDVVGPCAQRVLADGQVTPRARGPRSNPAAVPAP